MSLGDRRSLGVGTNFGMKVQTFHTKDDILSLVQAVGRSADHAMSRMASFPSGGSSLSALWAMKFTPIGCDPLDTGKPLNFIEQVNQSFTYLATARALELLFELHPELAPFTVNLGTTAGSDIESRCQDGLAAEVFAAVSPTNNRKLAKDIAKVGETSAGLKYVFFMCPGYGRVRQPRMERGTVRVWSVGAEP